MSDMKRRAELALKALVGESGGPDGGGQIKTGSLSVLKELFTERFVARGQPHPDGLLANTDGWHAFQELVPITDADRWDALRAAVYRELESDGWERINKPRGSQFVIPRKLLDGGDSARPLVILTWNPDKWSPDGWDPDEWWENEVSSWPDTDDSAASWSTGNRTTDLLPGDPAVLLRQGRDQGIIACGHLTSGALSGPHWSGDGRTAHYVGVEWTRMVEVSDRIDADELVQLVPEISWKRVQSSGTRPKEIGTGATIVELCHSRFGATGDGGRCTRLPDPDAERARLQGLESWAHYMLSSILAGGRPPGWNKPHAPSIFGEDLVRLIDEQAFGKSRPDRPELYWEFKLNKRPEDAQNGWPDNAFVWSDRLLMIEIKTEPGSMRDGQVSWYLQLGEANHPGRQIDLLFLTRDPVDAPSDMPEGARYANITWAELVEAIRPLSDLMDEADRRVVERYLEMLADFGVLSAGDTDQPEPDGNSADPAESVLVSPADWLHEAISLAERTAADGVQRALDIHFASWDEVKLAADRVRDSLDGTTAAERVQAWRWRRASSGEPLTAAGAAVGWELRFSQMQR